MTGGQRGGHSQIQQANCSGDSGAQRGVPEAPAAHGGPNRRCKVSVQRTVCAEFECISLIRDAQYHWHVKFCTMRCVGLLCHAPGRHLQPSCWLPDSQPSQAHCRRYCGVYAGQSTNAEVPFHAGQRNNVNVTHMARGACRLPRKRRRNALL